MLLFSSALVKHKLTFTKLSDRMDYVPVAAKWANGDIFATRVLSIVRGL